MAVLHLNERGLVFGFHDDILFLHDYLKIYDNRRHHSDRFATDGLCIGKFKNFRGGRTLCCRLLCWRESYGNNRLDPADHKYQDQEELYTVISSNLKPALQFYSFTQRIQSRF